MNRSRVTGDLTASGLLYADIANDRVGIGSTIPGNKLSLPDSAKIGLGNAEDLTLHHDGSNSYIKDTGTGFLAVQGSEVHIRGSNDENGIKVITNDRVELYYNNSKKLETTNTGSVVTGILTATSFSGSGANLTNLPDKDQIKEGNSYAEILDTGTNGIFRFLPEGSEVFRIDKDGKVGIGTNNAVGNLEVRDTKANFIVAKDGLTVKGNSNIASNYDFFQIGAGGALASYNVETVTASTHLIHNAYRSSAAGTPWKRRYQDTAMRLRMNSPGRAFIFESAASGSADADITSWDESLRIDSAGDIFIGTTSDIAPANGTNLCVSDATISRLILEKQSTIKYGLNVSSGFTIYDETNDAARFSITSTGKVGINETDPTSRLVVDAGTTSNAGACQLKNDSTSAYATNDGGINNVLSLISDGTNAAQSVGIQFSLNKSGETGCISEIGATRESNGNSTLVFRTRDSSTGRNERMRIDSSGNVGINETDPQRSLHIGSGGTFRFERGDGTRYGELWNDNSFVELKASTDPIRLNAQSYIRFDIAGNEKLRIDSTGRLLIGTQKTIGSASYYDDITINNSNGSGASGGTGITLISSTDSWASIYLGDSDNNGIGAIKYDHNTNSMRFVVNGTDPSVLIDSSSKVGLNGLTASSYYSTYNNLVIGKTNDSSGMTIVSGTSHAGYIAFADGTSSADAYRGRLFYSHSDNTFKFRCNGLTNDIFKIDSSSVHVTGTTDGVLNLDTSSSNGAFIRFKRAGTTKHWIGCANGLGGYGDNDDLTILSTDNIILATNSGPRVHIDSVGSILHKRSTNDQRYDLEFRQTGGISTGNYSGVKWTQGSTGGTFLAGILMSYHDTGRPDMVFYHRDEGGGTGSDEVMRLDRDGVLYFNSGYGSSAKAYGIRAWINFDMTNSSIRDSGNVASVTDHGVGDFAISFSDNIVDNDYAIGGTATNWEGTNADSYCHIGVFKDGLQSSSFRIKCIRSRFDQHPPQFKDSNEVMLTVTR